MLSRLVLAVLVILALFAMVAVFRIVRDEIGPGDIGVLFRTRESHSVFEAALAKRRLGRSELRSFSDWNDGRPETELNFKFYRQATNKIAAISDEAAAFLGRFF